MTLCPPSRAGQRILGYVVNAAERMGTHGLRPANISQLPSCANRCAARARVDGAASRDHGKHGAASAHRCAAAGRGSGTHDATRLPRAQALTGIALALARAGYGTASGHRCDRTSPRPDKNWPVQHLASQPIYSCSVQPHARVAGRGRLLHVRLAAPSQPYQQRRRQHCTLQRA